MALENPLHKFSTFNYNFVFGVCSARQANNPQQYREAPSFPIIVSGGHTNKTIKTYIEQQTDTNVEYFIDNVEINYLVNPNPGTSFSKGIKINFTVTEPGSVGLFFQSLSIAVEQAFGRGASYLGAPFMLQTLFKGFDDNNQSQTLPPHNMIFKLVNVTFDVTPTGAVYNVEAIPWNHQTFFDQIDQTPTDAAIKGSSVSEVLSWGEFSLQAHLNSIEEEKSNQDPEYTPHEFEILFPKDISLVNSPSKTSRRNGVLPGELRTFELDSGREILSSDQIARRADAAISSASPEDRLREEARRERLRVQQLNDIASRTVAANTRQLSELQSQFGQDTGLEDIAIQNQIDRIGPTTVTPVRANAVINTNDNELGQAIINGEAYGYGRIPFQNIDDSTVIEKEDGTRIIQRGKMKFDPDIREFMFSQGAKIQKMIESVLLGSEWGKKKGDELTQLTSDVIDTDGNITWFTIHSKSEIIDETMFPKTGMPAMRFVFIVTPQTIHSSILSGNAPQSYAPQIKKAAKHYHYTYTGLNTDVLNFTFNINAAFYREMSFLNHGTDVTESGDPVQVTQVQQKVPSVGPGQGGSYDNIPKVISHGNSSSGASGGSGDDSSAKRIAEHFNKIVLNSDIDNVELDLEILGDPYYMTEADFGNQFPDAAATGITQQGQIDTTRGEVYALISFRSSVDFVGNLTALDPVNSFSGVYKIVSFTNNFAGGRFTQNLRLIRMPNISPEDLNAVNSLIQAVDYTNQSLVIESLNRRSATRRQAGSLLQNAQPGVNDLATGFSNNNIDKIVEILSGTGYEQIAENVFSAFSQLQLITSGLNRTLGALSSILPVSVAGEFNKALGEMNAALPAAAQQLQNSIPGLFQNITTNDVANNILAGSQDINGDITRTLAGGLQQQIDAASAAGNTNLLNSLLKAQAELPVDLNAIRGQLPTEMANFKGELPPEIANAVNQAPTKIVQAANKVPGFIQQSGAGLDNATQEFAQNASARIKRFIS